MTFKNQKGTALTFVVIGVGLIAALSAGALYLTSTASLSGLSASDQNQAYQLAKAGIEYALTNNLATDKTYSLNEGKFSLKFSGDNIESTGIVKEGTPYETKRKVVVKQTGFGSRPDVSASALMDPINRQIAASKAGLITTDATTGQITLGQIGSTWQSQFGALWYKGGAAAGTCKDGRCEFGSGFRVFFVFKIYASTSGADGFTFAAFNGDTETNDVHSVGGHFEKGELLGYAGDSRLDAAGTTFLDYKSREAASFSTPLSTEKGRGIQPPKIAVEFDSYINSGGDITDYCDIDDSRRDGEIRNHVGYVFWGTNSSCTTMTTVGKNSCDDNKHNAGTDTLTDPRNSRRPSDGPDLSYYNAPSLLHNWLTNGYYAFRVEVTRKEETAGNYQYTMKSWIKPCTNLTCATYDDTNNFTNTKVKYDDTADPATLTRTFNLTEPLHNKFETFFFGWTMATGGATEEVKIARFRMNFQK